jgi:plasmid stability protein
VDYSGRRAGGNRVEVLLASFMPRLGKLDKIHHRSLEAELREILEQVSKQVDLATSRDLADRIRPKLKGRTHSYSAEMIREDRERLATEDGHSNHSRSLTSWWTPASP